MGVCVSTATEMETMMEDSAGLAFDLSDFNLSESDLAASNLSESDTFFVKPDDGLTELYVDFILFFIVVPILFGLICVVGVAGNCLVIYVILKRDRMRTVTNLLLLNLAAADLSFVLVIPPCTAYILASPGWPFGDTECRLMHYLVNVTAYVTVYTLVLISAIRYMTIVHNVRTTRIRTRRNVVIMIFMIWVVMMVVNSPIFVSYGRLVDNGTVICDNYSKEIGQRIFASFFVNAYVLPLGVIAVLSVCIVRHISRQKPSTLTTGLKTKSASKKRKAGRMLVLVVVVFALLWLPIHIHLLQLYFADLPEDDVYSRISWLWNGLAYFNSCVNPIIYNYTSKEFRDAFTEVARCGRGPRSSENGGGGTMRERPEGSATQVVRLIRQTANAGKDEEQRCADGERSPVVEELILREIGSPEADICRV